MNFLNFWFYFSCLYFFLPAYCANMTPPISAWLKTAQFLAKPIDQGKKFFGSDILGSHKTWRGIVLGTLVGMFVYAVQAALYHLPFFTQYSFFDYSNQGLFWNGFLLSFGALLGDMFFSFIKRRLKLPPGASFMPFDQTNYVIGAWFLFLLSPAYNLVPASAWIVIFALTFILHGVVNKIGYYLKISRAEW